eukprot:m.117290 g.117290  ORF g.117290 m.117290 type:complete len:76 (-) comp19468_c0_seq4:253-480(-)
MTQNSAAESNTFKSDRGGAATAGHQGAAEAITYSEPRGRPLRFHTRVLAVRAHCGAGKSHQANELIKRVRERDLL